MTMHINLILERDHMHSQLLGAIAIFGAEFCSVEKNAMCGAEEKKNEHNPACECSAMLRVVPFGCGFEF